MMRFFAFHLATLTFVASAVGQEKSATAPQMLLVQPEDLRVPEGSIDDLAKFLRETNTLKGQLNRQYRETMTEIDSALKNASRVLLEHPDEVSDEEFEIAANMSLPTRIRAIGSASESEKRALAALVERHIEVSGKRSSAGLALTNATSLAKYLERAGDDELARIAYTRFAEKLRDIGSQKLIPLAERFEGSARRLGLLGNTIEIKGALVNGDEFSWSKYQGKVVLIDFWATWCGPCLAEAPNVQKMYELYHDRGFEVVGISLDSDKSKLNDYLGKNMIPWENLFEEGTGWKHPMAVRYGVHAIPAAWLVDQDGKVVSLNARGGGLSSQLGLLIGPKHTKPRDLAVAGQWGDVTDEMQTLVDAGEGGRNYLMGLVAAQLLAGRPEAYAETCHAAFKQFKDSHRYAQATTVRICCLAPDSGVDPREMQAVARKAAAKIDDSPGFNKQKLALVLSNFRAGDYQACLDEPGQWGDPVQRVSVVLVQAMSAHHLGDREAATRYLALGNQIIEDELSDMEGEMHNRHMPDHWMGCAMAKVLQIEARALLEPKQP